MKNILLSIIPGIVFGALVDSISPALTLGGFFYLVVLGMFASSLVLNAFSTITKYGITQNF